MGADGVDHDRVDTVTFTEFCTQHGVCAFLVVVHGFAYIMQETTLLG